METFSALLSICAGNSPVTGEFPAQRPVTRSFDVCFDLRPNKRLGKQSWGWLFETPSRPLWRYCNAYNCTTSSSCVITVRRRTRQAKKWINGYHPYRPLSITLGLFTVTPYILGNIIYMPLFRYVVTPVSGDRVLIWRQDICNNHGDIGRLVRLRNTQTYCDTHWHNNIVVVTCKLSSSGAFCGPYYATCLGMI